MRVLGIDFGTSNTVAMVRTQDGQMRPLLFDGSPLLPSSVYFNTDGRVLVGRDAERSARADPSRFEPNPKRRIDDGEVFLGGQGVAVPRLFGYVLSQVVAEARRQFGAAPDEVRMTHPARWGERRRTLLIEAARLAGLAQPRLIAEPIGAASYFTAVLGTAIPVGRSLAIYDLGGGTFDATVVRRTQTGFEVLSEEGLPDVGGLDLDHAVVEYLGRMYEASHPAEWRAMISPTEPAHRRHRRMLYEDIRGAKEMLSRTASADIDLPALEVNAHLTRDEFETLIRPHLERTVACLQRAITGSRVAAKDLVGIFLVGGSSRIPLAAHLIHTELGVAPTTLDQPETVVVDGALRIGASGLPRPAPQVRQPATRQARPPVRAQVVSPVRPPQAQPNQAHQLQPNRAQPNQVGPGRPQPAQRQPAQRQPVRQQVVQQQPVQQQPARPQLARPQPAQPPTAQRQQVGPQPVRPTMAPVSPVVHQQVRSVSTPPGQARPVSPGPVWSDGQQAARRPTGQAAGRPVQPTAPANQRPGPFPPRPAAALRPHERKRPEPAVVLTMVVLALVAIAFVVLIKVAA